MHVTISRQCKHSDSLFRKRTSNYILLYKYAWIVHLVELKSTKTKFNISVKPLKFGQNLMFIEFSFDSTILWNIVWR